MDACAGVDGPEPASFAVKTAAFVYGGALYMVSARLAIGSSEATTGKMRQMEPFAKKLSFGTSQALPMENAASLLIDGTVATYMPGVVFREVYGVAAGQTCQG